MARLRGRRWQADIRLPDGARLRPTFSSEAQADAWEAQARLALQEGKPIPEVNTSNRPGSATRDLAYLGNVFDHVWRTEWSQAKAAKTLKINGQTVVDYFGRNKHLEEITSADVSNMKVELAGTGLAPGTVNRKVAALSKMLTTAKNAGAIERVPLIKWNQEVKTRFRYVDEKEERAMLAYWLGQNYDRAHDLTVMLIDTGARCFAEMIPVKWDAFSPGFAAVTFWATKTGKPRTVPLTKRCRELMAARKKLHPDSAGPFAGMNKHTFGHRWRAMQVDLSLPDVTPHTMRHTCCTRLILGGADVKRVMEWMGHSAIATTMRYMQIRPHSLEGLLDVLEGKDRREKAEAA